jgi:hypothetical protein
VNVGTEKQRQKTVEFSCIEAVARASGCKAVLEDEANQWPDGWLEHADGKREPVEVVAAFKRPAGEDPKKGASWLRHWKQGEAAARALDEKTGEAVSWHVGDDGFFLLDGVTPLPVAIEPIRQDDWVLLAVHQKIEKNYASGTPAVLVVQLNSPFPLLPFEVERMAEAIRKLGSRFKFAALWVVNNYGDPPVEITA